MIFLDDDNFEPPEITPSRVTSNKWEGEDEEDNVKVSDICIRTHMLRL